MELREIRDNEIELLQDFLYEAIFIPEGVEPPARDIIEQPELKLYYEGFGKVWQITVLSQRMTVEWLEQSGLGL